MSKTEKFRLLDLFSGIGGFSIAAQYVWKQALEIVAFVEKESFCQKILNKNFKGVKIYGDIKDFDGRICGQIDLLTGGFPCQPFSCAGKRRGSEDDRYLWPEMLRVISEARPRWIIGENVAGIVNMVLDNLCTDLENEGYEVQPFIIPACAVNAPHRRDRVWIVAHSNYKRHSRVVGEKIFKQEDTSKLSSRSQGRNTILGIECQKDVSNAKSAGLERTIAERNTCSTRLFAEHGQREWQTDWWKTEPNVDRMADGIPNRVDRLKALGNAIVPQTVVPIMQAIKDIDNKYGKGVDNQFDT